MLTRFAPSPTGYLHVGNIRTALICWLYCRNQQGKFVLRFDDTDNQRSKGEYKQGIIDDLSWLGINWDISFNQSSRFTRYEEIFNHLLKEGFVYPCYESTEALDLKRKMQLKSGLPPIYDRAALRLTAAQKNEYCIQKRSPHFRFKLTDDTIISWDDEVRGMVMFSTKNISDPVIKRADGTYTYMLPSTIDDMDYNITHIIRGEDHISNTAIQINMLNALKAKVPTFAHLSLLYVDDNKISKRIGGSAIKSLKDQGLEAMAINSYLAKIGTADPIDTQVDLQSLTDSFDIKKFSQAPTKFNLDDILKLNAKILHKTSFINVKDRLQELGIESPEFWYSVRNNMESFLDIKEWWQICNQNIVPIVTEDNKDFIILAASLLPEGEWNENTWQQWISKIKEKTDRKGQNLFAPLRLALTGKNKGPELAKLLPLLGRKTVISRMTTR